MKELKLFKIIDTIAKTAFLLLAIGFMPITANAAETSSIDKAVLEIRQQTKGKVISADTVTQNNSLQHRIKVLMPNGHVKIFYKAAH